MFMNFKQSESRSGVVLVAVLVCLIIAMMLGAALTKSIMLQHRQLRVAGDQCQSLWLADSAVQRATHGLRESAGYRGETWRIPASLLGSPADGVVVIKVVETRAPEAGWIVTVTSRYPDALAKRVLVQRSVFVEARAARHSAAEQ